MPVYVVRPAILFGPSDPSAFVKGFALKSRWDGLLAEEERQALRRLRPKFQDSRNVKTSRRSRRLVLFPKLIN